MELENIVANTVYLKAREGIFLYFLFIFSNLISFYPIICVCVLSLFIFVTFVYYIDMRICLIDFEKSKSMNKRILEIFFELESLLNFKYFF